MRFGLALLRILIGVLMMGHGLQKLKGWFGGYGLEATGQAFEGMGLRPGKAHATASGLSEFVGGALLATGFLTPLGAAMITGGMTIAIDGAPGERPLGRRRWLRVQPRADRLGLRHLGRGPRGLSLDDALGTGRRGPGVRSAELAAGAVGGAAVIARARQASAGKAAKGLGPPAA